VRLLRCNSKAFFAALILFAVIKTMCAQQAAPGIQPVTLETLLARLGEQAAALERSMPGFTCLQTASSDELLPGKKNTEPKVTRHVTFTANVRVRRGPDGQLAESAEFLTVNGQPFTGGGFTMPAYAQGGFRQALAYFLPSQQVCFRYKLSAGRIEFEGPPDAAKIPGCRSAGTHGFAALDDEGNLLHLERRVSLQGTLAYALIPFAELDLAPVTLKDVTYRLSSHLLSERQNGRFLDRFESTYTGCKLFTATVTIGPAANVPQ
jgi:hypothetical protein